VSPSLFRYISSRHLGDFLEGRVRFQSLATYRAFEDAAIGDLHEGKFRKRGMAQVERPSTGERFTVPGFFDSDALVAEVFVFCTSRVRCVEIALEFGADVCVEITDVEAFTSRLRDAVATQSPSDVLLDGAVEYHAEGAEDPTGIVWAFPDRIAMRKSDLYRAQHEHRFLLGARRVLELHGVQPTFTPGEVPPPPGPAPNPPIAPRFVEIGNIRDIARPHRYWKATLRLAAAWKRLREFLAQRRLPVSYPKDRVGGP
jgi:hypothetical protein